MFFFTDKNGHIRNGLNQNITSKYLCARLLTIKQKFKFAI